MLPDPDPAAIGEEEAPVAPMASSEASKASEASEWSVEQATAHADEPSADSIVDAQIGRLLETLSAAAPRDAGADLSLARLSKRSGLPMSTLRRFLIALEDAGLVRFTLGEDGRGTAGLTAQGRELIDAADSGHLIQDV